MKAVTKITFFDDDGNKFFGEGPARLLRAVEEYGSLRRAAASMNMAYTKALKLVRQAEQALGYPVIRRTTGGKDGGGSVLTGEGSAWLSRYESYREDCLRSCQRLYDVHFPPVTIGNYGCVIMASGLGTRFGGNKLMAPFHSSPLICRILDATEGLFVRRVVVTRHEAVASLCRERGIDVVFHDLLHRNDTVRLGLEAIGDVDGCLFCPGDQPLLRRETIVSLIRSAFAEPESIWRPSFENTPGSPVLFPKWAFPELLTLPEGTGGGWVIKHHPERVAMMPILNPWELTDADTPEALELLRQQFRPERSRL